MDASLKTDLETVKGLLTSATKCLNELDVHPRGRGVYLDAVVLAILSKSIRVGEAICLLVEKDFHSEAFGLSRTMLELALAARYISNADEFKRSQTFVKYYAKDHEGWTKLISKYYPTAVPAFNPDHDQMLEIAKQFKDPHKWSGKTVKELAVEAFLRDLLTVIALSEVHYEVISTSHYVHGTVVGVRKNIRLARVSHSR